MNSTNFILILLVAGSLLFSGCYSAEITTDRTPSGQTIEKSWATGFINGLAMVDSNIDASECSNGVARVETKLSFLNQLVGGLTFGLYSPMTVKVTCATDGGRAMLHEAPDLEVPRNATQEEINATLQEASFQSMKTSEPVSVRFAQR